MNEMFKKGLHGRLPLNLQLFAEGEEGGGQQQQNNQQQQNQSQTQQPPAGKVWTDEYVSGLRSEAAQHRTEKKKLDGHLRSLIGLKPDDELNDSVISTFKQTQERTVSEALAKANARLLAAEIKSLPGYDAKLVERLLDKSKITIGEDGAVTGLKEAVEELAKEFPSIVTGGNGGGGGAPNPGAQGGQTELQQLEEAYTKATSQPERIAIKNKIHQLQLKQLRG